jgi:hypothetical protein
MAGCCARRPKQQAAGEQDGPVGNTTPEGIQLGRAERLPPFGVSTTDLALLNVPGKEEENRRHLEALGGPSGVCAALCVDSRDGLHGDAADLRLRSIAFGENRFPEPPFESWLSLFLECFQDLILIILIVSAVVSLIIGSIQDPGSGWIDGVAILVAVLLVASVTATNDYHKQVQFRVLHSESASRVEVQVTRAGRRAVVGVADLVVGDLVHVETGCKVRWG